MRTQEIAVTGRDGLRGVIEDPELLDDPRSLTACVKLENGSAIWVPLSLLTKEAGGQYSIPLSYGDIARSGTEAPAIRNAPTLPETNTSSTAPSRTEDRTDAPTLVQRKPLNPTAGDDTLIVPVVEERADIRTRRVEEGVVHIRKTVTDHEETVNAQAFREDVEITRVPVNRIIDGPVAVREEGDITIVPLIEEVAVVVKRLMLREELHIRKRRTEEPRTERITLRKEEAHIERTDNRA